MTQPNPRPGFPGSPPPRRPLRVLVVDDAHDQVLSMMMLLRDAGHDAKGVSSGEGAIKAIRDYCPDAVILDIGLPGKSGWQVAREIRSTFGKQLLLIAVTAYGGQTDEMLSRLTGIDHHLVKPADPRALLSILEKQAPLTPL